MVFRRDLRPNSLSATLFPKLDVVIGPLLCGDRLDMIAWQNVCSLSQIHAHQHRGAWQGTPKCPPEFFTGPQSREGSRKPPAEVGGVHNPLLVYWLPHMARRIRHWFCHHRILSQPPLLLQYRNPQHQTGTSPCPPRSRPRVMMARTSAGLHRTFPDSDALPPICTLRASVPPSAHIRASRSPPPDFI